jgi:transposase
VDVITDAQDRLDRLDAQLAELVPSWSMAPVVAAYQALRGVSFIVAVTFVSEIGDVRRFDNPRQLMAFLGLVPSERSTGDTVKRGSLTLAGNRRARRALVEGAWSYRYPARVTEPIRVRLEGLPKAVREIAWKAQTRLCARYRRMTGARQKETHRRCGDCARDGGVPVGHRPPGRTGALKNATRSCIEDQGSDKGSPGKSAAGLKPI